VILCVRGGGERLEKGRKGRNRREKERIVGGKEGRREEGRKGGREETKGVKGEFGVRWRGAEVIACTVSTSSASDYMHSCVPFTLHPVQCRVEMRLDGMRWCYLT
jgi:hypothetical protein